MGLVASYFPQTPIHRQIQGVRTEERSPEALTPFGLASEERRGLGWIVTRPPASERVIRVLFDPTGLSELDGTSFFGLAVHLGQESTPEAHVLWKRRVALQLEWCLPPSGGVHREDAQRVEIVVSQLCKNSQYLSAKECFDQEFLPSLFACWSAYFFVVRQYRTPQGLTAAALSTGIAGALLELEIKLDSIDPTEEDDEETESLVNQVDSLGEWLDALSKLSDEMKSDNCDIVANLQSIPVDISFEELSDWLHRTSLSVAEINRTVTTLQQLVNPEWSESTHENASATSPTTNPQTPQAAQQTTSGIDWSELLKEDPHVALLATVCPRLQELAQDQLELIDSLGKEMQERGQADSAFNAARNAELLTAARSHWRKLDSYVDLVASKLFSKVDPFICRKMEQRCQEVHQKSAASLLKDNFPAFVLALKGLLSSPAPFELSPSPRDLTWNSEVNSHAFARFALSWFGLSCPDTLFQDLDLSRMLLDSYLETL